MLQVHRHRVINNAVVRSREAIRQVFGSSLQSALLLYLALVFFILLSARLLFCNHYLFNNFTICFVAWIIKMMNC